MIDTVMQTELAALVDKTVRHLARIHPSFRFVRDERQWVVFCRNGAWQVFDSWPNLTVYASRAMQAAKVPVDRRADVLQRLVPAMRSGRPIAVASRDDLPRNPFIGMHMAKTRAARQ